MRVLRTIVNLLVLAGIAVLGVASYYWLEPDRQGSHATSCRPPEPSTTAAAKPPRRQRQEVTLAVAEGATTSFDLGHDTNSGVRTIPFVLSRPLWGRDRVTVSPGTFAPAEQNGRPLGPRAVRAWAVLDRAGTTGTAYVCIAPGARERAPWGTFTGNLVFEDRRVAPTVVPMTVTASYPKVHNVAAVGVGVCLLASLYVYFLRDRSGADPGAERADEVLRWPFSFLKRYGRYMTDMVGVLTVASGLVAASAAFTAQYLSADVWTAEPSEWLTFCGAVATAFVAGGTAGRLAGNRYAPAVEDKKGAGDGENGQGEQQPSGRGRQGRRQR